MTSTVTIAAHCADHKEVRVQIYEHGDQTVLEQFTMENGETQSRAIFDGRCIAVGEFVKEAPSTDVQDQA